MKKLYSLLILIALLFIPSNVKAYNAGISNYYIDATIQENGDVHVKELFVLTGEFNGFERIVNYRNASAPDFYTTSNPFGGSDIYNGNGIELVKITNIPVDSEINFNYIDRSGNPFSEVIYASVGDGNVYTKTITNDGEAYKIFNPSSGIDRGFYVEYILKNMVVVHNDIAELGWNIFSTELNENIGHLEVRIHLPGNSDTLRVWAHGPLQGSIDPSGKNGAIATIDQLNQNTAMDIRIAFDKTLVPASTKLSGNDGLTKILEVEKALADTANNQRNIAKAIYYSSMIAATVWSIGLVFLIIFMYNKYDKERQSTFRTKYFRDFPGEYGPEIVNYLFSKPVSNIDLSASVLNLITKKIIVFEELEKDKFSLKYVDKTTTVTVAEKKILTWFFDEIGTNDTVTMDVINNAAKSDYSTFLANFNTWKTYVGAEGKSKDFFENTTKPKVLASLYAIFGIIMMALINFNLGGDIIYFVGMFMAIVAFIYFVSITKKTVSGNEQYSLWKGLKNFLKDFGKFENKDLPQVFLWEKYLVYALVFGEAKKLSKTMSIKFTEIYGNNTMANTSGFDMYRINRMMMINNLVNTGVTHAVSTATSTKMAAESRSSSGGGYGGGFSSGGGSFGGGGGGGRF